MIVSSFAQQYGIRLHNERDTISYLEYRQLLIGLNTDTPLGYVVNIRSEKDPKKIREMTKQEKKIRSDWQEFKKGKNSNNVIELKGNDINKVFSQMFG